jgi:RNA polymerase sigma-70 factor (ECF subfamily)
MSVVRNVADDGYLTGLMRAAQGGDERAYARLLTDIVPRLRHLIRRRRPFLQTTDVEDLVQEVLLSLHAVRATYDPERPFMPWLFAIAHNRMADGARRYARRAAHEVLVEQLPVTFAGDDANYAATGYGDPEALRQAMACLPRGQRDAVEMLKLRELSLKEASAQTGTSVGALKVSVHRGMMALRKALAKVQPQ